MVCEDEKIAGDNIETDDEDHNDREQKKTLSLGKTLVVAAVMPFLATSAEAMFGEEDYEEKSSAIKAYSILSLSLNYGNKITKNEFDEIKNIQLSPQERTSFKEDMKILIQSNGEIENPIIFLKQSIEYPAGYEVTEVENFKKYLENIAPLIDNKETSSDFHLLLSSALDELVQRDFR